MLFTASFLTAAATTSKWVLAARAAKLAYTGYKVASAVKKHTKKRG